ncbi:MAG: c-type cytochrome biogenesis protein CcmI [Pseudomonadales bacterium]|nr:c-type cytochrome biogenesis protein CcmI [Pseudomonadales bacterium]
MFWFYAAALLVLAALFILLPLWKFHRGSDATRSRRERTNLLIFTERVAELEAELAAGTLDEENFAALKSELERSLLTDVKALPETTSADSESGKSGWLSVSRIVPLVMVLAAIPTSVFLYHEWGFQDELKLKDIFDRTQTSAENPEQIRDLIFEIGEIIEKDRQNGWAWYFLAQNLVTIGQFPEASMALQRASENIDEPQDKVIVLSQYAFLEYMLADQQLTDKVQAIVDETQRLDPNQVLILQILGMDAEQRQDYQAAITYWRRMLQLTSPGEESELLQGMIANAQQQLTASGQDGAVSGPSVDIELSLAPGLELPGNMRVFVSALEYNGRPQPLAVKVLSVADLPTTVTLSDADAVGPFNLSSAEMITVVATASTSGSANVQAGDYQVRSEGFAQNGEHAILQLQITDQVQ